MNVLGATIFGGAVFVASLALFRLYGVGAWALGLCAVIFTLLMMAALEGEDDV